MLPCSALRLPVVTWLIPHRKCPPEKARKVEHLLFGTFTGSEHLLFGTITCSDHHNQATQMVRLRA